MATVRVRAFVDYEVEEALLPSEHQQEVVAKNISNFVHNGLATVDIVDEPDLVSATNPVYGAHVHNASADYCQGCVQLAGDGLS